MSLETGIFISDLVSINPPDGDPESQGAGHLRLIKALIQGSFPTLGGQFSRVIPKSATYSAVALDNYSTFLFSAIASLNLPASATAGIGYSLVVIANGAGVTVNIVCVNNPTQEKINGQTNITLQPNQTALLFNTRIVGSEWVAIIIPVLSTSLQSTITGNITLSSLQFTGTQNITATATVNLPAAVTVPAGTSCSFKSSTTGNVLLAPNGSDSIDGSNASFRIPSFDTWELQSNGVNGYIIVRRGAARCGDIKWSCSANSDVGWIPAIGSVSRTTYAGLFAEISTLLGTGDGSTTFGVDVSGRDFVATGTATAVETLTNITAASNAVTVASNSTKWITGMTVVATNCSGFTGLTNGTYFVIRISNNSIKLATSLANSQAGTAMTISGTGSATLTWTGTNRSAGDIIGEESHALSITELLVHSHVLTDPGHSHVEQYTLSGALQSLNTSTGGTNLSSANAPSTASATTGITMATTGGNVAANNMQPSIGMYAYIKT